MKADRNTTPLTRRAAITGAVAAAAVPIAAASASASEDSEILRLGHELEPVYGRFLNACRRSHETSNRFYRLVYEATGYKHCLDAPMFGEPGFEEYSAEYERISRAFHEDPANFDEDWDELRDGAMPLAERILELEPKTLADLGVQARAMAYIYDEWWPQPFWGEEEKLPDEILPRLFIERVLRLAGLPQPLQTADAVA